MDLSGKVALITGGNRGIGAGCSLALAKGGADIALTYRRDEDSAKETAAAIEALGRKAMIIQADVSSEEEAKAADTRRNQIGSGDRSERIRTYNFPQNRVTDHRINLTIYKLDQIMLGQVQPITDALIDFDRQQLRDSMESK